MKKFLSLLLVISILTSLLTTLASCGGFEEDEDDDEDECVHYDVDNDGFCDECGEKLAPSEKPCEHKDGNDDNICDECEQSFSDGCDNHVDKNDNKKCDVPGCRAEFDDGCDADHIDKNDDGLCDEGGEEFEDGCDKHRDADDDGECDTPYCNKAFDDGCDKHADKDDNGKCDFCRAAFDDGCDAYHIDKNDDGLCDEGGEEFEDGCDNHRDADDDKKCDNGGEDFEDGCDATHADKNDDGKCDNGGEDFEDGCDATHADKDDNGKCDFGGEDFDDGCDNHVDVDDDGKCDFGGEDFEDGCDNHRDADDDLVCDIDGCDEECDDGCDNHRDANDDGKCDFGGEDFDDGCDNHADKDDDKKCDFGGEDFEDGCDNHKDIDDNGKCDVAGCGKAFTDGCDKKDCLDIDDDGLCDNKNCDKPTANKPVMPCTHRDADDNSKCDHCEIGFEDDCDVHRDADDDAKCDICESEFEDGCDAEHRDANDDKKCDFGGEAFEDGCDAEHRDADDDKKCDFGGEDFEDGCDIHRDANDDKKCDVCRVRFDDGCDNHIDVDDNGKCDVPECGKDFTDGCDNHVDEDDDKVCDVDGCDEEWNDGCDAAPCVDEDDDGECDNCGFECNDGCDVAPCRDANDDGKCDNCGFECNDGCDLLKCRDKDDDLLCDRCGFECNDGCEGTHVDDNKDTICDKCGKDANLCSHIDENDDLVCDKCEEEYDDGCDFHVDDNDDWACDKCNEDYYDGHDVCYDYDDDLVCDYVVWDYDWNEIPCGKPCDDGCDFHVDANDDWACDKCDEYCDDGHDVCYDYDDDLVCDYVEWDDDWNEIPCGKPCDDGCDNMIDADDDGKCDNCEGEYEDGCDNHVDADNDGKCDVADCGIDMPGTEANPIMPEINTDADYNPTGFTVVVPAGKTVYYQAYIGGMILTIKADVTVVLNGQTYTPDENGTITIEVPTAMGGMPVYFNITNDGARDVELTASLAYPKGSMENPNTLNIGNVTVQVAEGNSQGVYYVWVAKADGIFTISFAGNLIENSPFVCQVLNLTTYQMLTLFEATYDEANDVTVITIDVTAGDELVFAFGSMPDAEWNFPAVTINATVAFECAVCVDADDNLVCDVCENACEDDGCDVHADADNDYVCDTEGCDEHVHRDANDDIKCDDCGADFDDAPEASTCNHRDADDDYICDVPGCGMAYRDACDIHIDADDNLRCDKCNKSGVDDGQDLPEIPETPDRTDKFDDIDWGEVEVVMQLNLNSSGNQLEALTQRYMAGEEGEGERIDDYVADRNNDAYDTTGVYPTYTYLLETDGVGWGAYPNRIATDIATFVQGETPDMYCGFAYDLTMAATLGYFKNLYNDGSEKGNYFTFLLDDYRPQYDDEGYLIDFMESMTPLPETKMYLYASNYTIDVIRSMYVIPVSISLLGQMDVDDLPDGSDRNDDGFYEINEFYDMVRDVQWTYSMMAELSAAIFSPVASLTSNSLNNVNGFVLDTSMGLPSAGMTYSVDFYWADQVIDENGNYSYVVPKTNANLEAMAIAYENLFKADGIFMSDGSMEAEQVGTSGSGMGIRQRFSEDMILFGGVVLVGALDYDQYQNMENGFGIAPIPLYATYEGAEYRTAIHNLARVVGISKESAYFSEITAFLDYQALNSDKVMNLYYRYLQYETVVGEDYNIEILDYLRDHIRSNRDQYLENICNFKGCGIVDAITGLDQYKWAGFFKNKSFQASTIRGKYEAASYLKNQALAKLVEMYEALDGKEISPSCSHRDANDDYRCDKCNGYYSDGCDNHRDANDDGFCDKCETSYSDGIESSEGLIFELNDDGESYTLVEVGSCNESHIVIDFYKGLPVTGIGEDAFDYCTSLTSVTIGNSVESIGDYAFQSCTSLTSVTIGNSVESIGNWAFYGCTSLTSVTIPDSVTSIGYYAFEECTSLMSIVVDNYNNYYSSIDGNLYTKDGKTLIQYAIGKTDTSFTIPNGVTSIGDCAFEYCTSLTSVTIGDSVEVLGSYAFAYCSKLTEVTLGNSLRDIGYDAFSYCTSLTSVTIPDSVTSIGSYAFYDCDSLTSVTIGDSVESIGYSAFSGCSSLTSIVVDNNNNYYSSIDGNLYTKDGKTLIQYAIGKTDTSFTIPNGVTSIGYSAFEFCSSLTSVTIPDSVTSIDSYAFFYCTNLSYIYCEATSKPSGWDEDWNYGCDATIIWDCDKCQNHRDANDDGVCDKCETSYSDGIESSEGLIFELNDDGESYTLVEVGSCNESHIVIDSYKGLPVISIGEDAFKNCTSLTSVTIPDSVTSIGDFAFYNCSSLTGVTIGNSVTSIGDFAFYYCTRLTSVTIGNSVESIGEGAFYYCTNLTSVTIGNSVESIGSYAFRVCTSLTSVTIPDSVTSIGSGAFGECYKLVEVINKSSRNIKAGSSGYGDVAYYAKEVHSGESKIVNYNNYLFYTYNGVNYLLGYVGNNTNLILPENYNGENYEIYKYAFYYCNNLTSVTIPNSVTSIGERAFYYCSSLTSVTIGDSVTSIGSYAFYNCTSLTSIVVDNNNNYYSSIDGNLYTKDGKTLIQYAVGKADTSFTIPNSVTNIGSYAFYNCTSLTSVMIGDSVTSIGEGAFYYCTNLTSVTIGNSVESIGYCAFEDCTSLTSVTIPDSVEVLGSFAFAYCSKLTEVTLGNSLRDIGYSAFEYCTSLTSVTIPDSVTSIGDNAFSNCTSLTSVTIGNSVESIGSYAFDYCTNLSYIYCEATSKPSGWNEYWNNGCDATIIWDCDKCQNHRDANDDGFCDKCETSYSDGIESSEGLIFELNDDGESYTLVEVGSCNESHIVIDSYKGLPVTSIGEDAFRNCTSLTSVTIGDSVESIGSYAFRACTKLVEVINKSSLDITVGSSNYGNVAYYAIEVHSGESKIVNYNDYLFYTYNGVNYLLGYVGNNTNLILPESYNGENYEIYKLAFYGCTSLTSVTIPDSVTSIGNSAFASCPKLVEVINKSSLDITAGSSDYGYVACYAKEVHSGESKIVNYNDYLFYTYDGVNNLIGYVGNNTDLILPESYNGENYEIYKYAFSYCTNLTSVTIGNSVESIGYCAFRDCTSLTSVTISDSVTSIGNGAFYRCTSLTSVTLGNSVTYIGDSAFAFCSSLTSVTIPDSVTSIDFYAFNTCTSLTSVTIGDSVTSIGEDAFGGCSSLTSIVVDNNNNYCSSIDGNLYTKDGKTLIQYATGKTDTSFTIPNGVTSIGYSAFGNCTSLTSVTIPDSVTSIGYDAFYYCTNLSYIYCEAASKPSGWDVDWNNGCDATVVWGYENPDDEEEENKILASYDGSAIDKNIRYSGTLTESSLNGDAVFSWTTTASSPTIYVMSTTGGYAAIKSQNKTVSYYITLAKDGSADVLNVRGRINANQKEVELFEIDANGNVYLGRSSKGGKFCFKLTEELQALRIVLDFDDETLSAYDENGFPIVQINVNSISGFDSIEEWRATLDDTISLINIRAESAGTLYIGDIVITDGNAFLPEEGTELFGIYYYTNGGILPSGAPTSFFKGESINTLPELTHPEGYEFLGWYLDPTFTTPIYYISSTTNESVSLYAKFSGKLVTYIDASGSDVKTLSSNFRAVFNGIFEPVDLNGDSINDAIEWSVTDGGAETNMPTIVTRGNEFGYSTFYGSENAISLTLNLSQIEGYGKMKSSFRIGGTTVGSATEIFNIDEYGNVRLKNGTSVVSVIGNSMTTVRIVVDFNLSKIIAYDEYGYAIDVVSFTVPKVNGVTVTAEEWRYLYTEAVTLLNWRIQGNDGSTNADGSTRRYGYYIGGLTIKEGNVFN